MSQEFIDYREVPCLQEILNFLPVDPQGEEDINNYVRNVTEAIFTNYKYGHYQFAYFGVHLLYMTYIYCTAWKIGHIENQRYKDAIIFAKPYRGRERDFSIEEASSVFAYSLMPEKDIAKLFRLIELDTSCISKIGGIVEARNEMAHASGKLEICLQENFDNQTNIILSSMKMIHKKMDTVIRKWYGELLLKFCSGEYQQDYGDEDFSDFIYEQIIQKFKLSVNELLVCNEMSMIKLIETNP